MRPHNLISSCCLLTTVLLQPTLAQQPTEKPPQIKVESNLVIVPALVKTEQGDLVYSLTADDFLVRDNGAEQKIRLENDLDLRPLVLVVAIQTAGNGARQQRYEDGLATMIENLEEMLHIALPSSHLAISQCWPKILRPI